MSVVQGLVTALKRLLPADSGALPSLHSSAAHPITAPRLGIVWASFGHRLGIVWASFGAAWPVLMRKPQRGP
ncbi:hypothetical protein [Candidatus Viridilinea mediisalina]|uniref:hypothetical protein n=1 Tax=Candidatus Viridilinea mediisalina TaxID=2024553 RepID=UPI000F5B614A|nr:hypothetical protein [Candidatus Viridilinea mediisalina]